jgi:hypothetical protein
VFDHVWAALLDRRASRVPAPESLAPAVDAPRPTNAEVVTIVMAWLAAAPRDFPLWYQFAAVAYGWDPTTDTLDVSSKQRDALYDADASTLLWGELFRLSSKLDADRVADPRISLDGSFSDPVFQGEVRAALLQDGASAQFKIPIPSCRDPKTGRPKGRPQKNPKTGQWECRPVLVDDPITAAKTSVLTLIAILAIGWVVFTSKPRRRRRNEG